MEHCLTCTAALALKAIFAMSMAFNLHHVLSADEGRTQAVCKDSNLVSNLPCITGQPYASTGTPPSAPCQGCRLYSSSAQVCICTYTNLQASAGVGAWCHPTHISCACHCCAAVGEAPARAHERAEHLIDSGALCDLPGHHGVEALHWLQLEVQGRPQPHRSCRVRLCLQAHKSTCRLLMRIHNFMKVLLQAVSAQVVLATVLRTR